MAPHAKLKFLHSPVRTYPSLAQGNYVGAQATAGRRGTLPTFDDTNSYFVAKTGSDSNAGTAAAPKLTLGSLFSTSQSFNDTSGNGYHLTQSGTVMTSTFPCFPLPPQGNSYAGTFTDTAYLACPAGLCTAMSSDTFTIEGWIYLHTLAASSKLFSNTTGTIVEAFVNSGGDILFTIAGTTLGSASGLVAAGQWYYAAFVYTSGAANGKKIYLGTTPENAVAVATATQTQAITGLSGARIGRAIGAGSPWGGYLDRLVFSTVARTSFPTLPTDSNIAGMYEMETRPLMQTAPKDYIVIADSETYSEGLRANFYNDILTGYGIYAADGSAPTFKRRRGATPGTYGAGNSARAVLSASPNYYINQTTGDDGTGARGNPALPFKTIQAALSDGSITAGDVIQIQDSAAYTEDLSLGTLNLTIQAAAGQTPSLHPATKTSTSVHLTVGASSPTVNLSGILFDGQGTAGKLLNTASSPVVNFYDCSLSRYAAMGIINPSLYSCSFSEFDGGGVKRAENSYIKLSGESLTASVLYRSTVRITGINQIGISASGNTAVGASECLFLGEGGFVTLANSGGSPGFSQTYAYANEFDKCFLVCAANNLGALSIVRAFVAENYINMSGAQAYTYAALSSQVLGVLFASLTNSSFSVGAYNNVVAGAGSSYLHHITSSAVFSSASRNTNNTSINASIVGLDAPSTITTVGFASASDLLAYQGGVVPTYTPTSVQVASTSSSGPNATLHAQDGGIYTGGTGANVDAGACYSLFDVQTRGTVTFNGLILEGSANQEGGIGTSNDQPFDVAFCTFNDLGFYGIKAPASASIESCVFAVNGHGIRTNRQNVTIRQCVAYNCEGAAILFGGANGIIEACSASSCTYGLYEIFGGTYSSLEDIILGQSGAYDYSGDNEVAYSCIGTLDPEREATLDVNSIRLDPLFRDPANGDLRLMAVAAGAEFDSPCLAEGSTGADMGAFAFTYGSCELTWIEVNFETVTPGGKNYRNPDKLSREMVPVKLAENDREDAKFDSNAVAYKLQFTCTWAEPNDMPIEQLIELRDMFCSTANEMHACIDGGWLPARLVRGSGFQYEENSELGYTESDTPTPLRTLTFREE